MRDYKLPLTPPTRQLLLHVLLVLDEVLQCSASAGGGAQPDGGELLSWAAARLEGLGLRCASFQSNRLPPKEPTATLRVLKIVAECPLKGESGGR